MTQWNNYPISQGYNPGVEQGVDIATPYHTPITALYGGQVVTSNYQPWGGDVGIQTTLPGIGQVIEYFQHLDLNQVSVGQTVQPGQQIGLSGGQTSGGNHPALTGSTGPHTEFGFGPSWIPGSKNIDPTPYLSGTGIGGAPTVQQAVNTAAAANSLLTGSNNTAISLPSNDFWIRAGLVAVGLVLLFIAIYGLLQRGPTVIEENSPQ